jgi:azobenzene reductase
MSQPPRLLVLSGSPMPDSRTRALADTISHAAMLQGARAAVIDVARGWPAVDVNRHGACLEHPDLQVREFGQRVSDADGLVLVSPVYHNSYSGSLKALLDHLDPHHFDAKPVSVAAHASVQRSTQACDHLRSVIRSLHGVGMPHQVVSVDADFCQVDSRWRLRSPATGRRVIDLVRELITMAAAVRAASAEVDRALTAAGSGR